MKKTAAIALIALLLLSAMPPAQGLADSSLPDGYALEKGIDALRSEMKNRESGDKERVAKFAFESKLAQKMAESSKNDNPLPPNDLPPIELDPDNKDKKIESSV